MTFDKDTRLFVVVGPTDTGYLPARYIVFTTYGRNGGCVARSYMTGDQLGRAGGGGYDITAAALVDFIGKRWPDVPRIDGATGLSTITPHYATHGVNIYATTDIMWGGVPSPALVTESGRVTA